MESKKKIKMDRTRLGVLKTRRFAPARQSLLGFRLRSPRLSGEEPCPLSLQTVFSTPSLVL